MDGYSPENTARKNWMSLLAKAPAADLAALWQAYGANPQHTFLRAPEIGSVMVRGRMGAVGSGFNLGEVTITRCSVRVSGGADGHAYVQGRDRDKATTAALIDALMQSAEAPKISKAILEPLRVQSDARKSRRAEKAAATKVDFFTMARGED